MTATKLNALGEEFGLPTDAEQAEVEAGARALMEACAKIHARLHRPGDDHVAAIVSMAVQAIVQEADQAFGRHPSVIAGVGSGVGSLAAFRGVAAGMEVLEHLKKGAAWGFRITLTARSAGLQAGS